MTAAALAMPYAPSPRSGYRPPENWRTETVESLLIDTPRWKADPKQLTFLDRIAKTDGALKVFVVGDAGLLQKPCVAVIGTRKVSPEGAARARRLARDLVNAGVVVVSGLAEGVDTEAMSSAIAHQGRTIGVIGTPIDKAYPAKNADLQQEVYRDHLLVSQFAHGEKVYKTNFPVRNRLMAILSDATVVIEASDTSGTLHQAAECTKLGRWLFIAKSVVEDKTLTWPAKFLKYERCVVLEKAEDILNRVLPAGK